jgi:peroxiredoxin
MQRFLNCPVGGNCKRLARSAGLDLQKEISMRHIARGLLVSLLLLGSHGGMAEAGDRAPDFVLADVAGNMTSLASFRGKPLVLHFWATWCPYCRKVQPGLDALQTQFSDSELVVVGVSFRENDGADPQGVLEQRGVHFRTLLEGDDVASLYAVRGTPTTFFIDRKGRIIGMTHTSDPEDPLLTDLARAISQR